MKGYPLKRLLFLIAVPIAISCVKSAPPLVKTLENSIAKAEEKLESIETALKNTPEQNQGLIIKLQQDKQLAVSRLERLKENLFSIAPHKKLESKPAPEGGHGGGH